MQILFSEVVVRNVTDTSSGLGFSDWVSLLSLVVAGISFFLSLLAGYLNKRIDLIGRKFEKLCLEPVEASFKGLDTIFATNRQDLVVNHSVFIFDSLSASNLLLLELQGIYPRIDFIGIERLCDQFSDLVAQELLGTNVGDYSSKYFYAKTQVLDSLFRYAMEDQIQLHWRHLMPWRH